jgi:predicted ATPase
VGGVLHVGTFPQQVHTRRQEVGDEEDPLPHIASMLLSESWVLCFDEFQVTDVADAMVMARLFAAYFDLGGLVIATSNRAPDSLFVAGTHRPLALIPPPPSTHPTAPWHPPHSHAANVCSLRT